ncbi:amidohydrolase [Fundidesulfovibrio terrae]|uniref:amidohydrolase n=1 Tax=Fundidesulfovibrio terrae TaxID=2922866 RepID=UPI001FAECDA5|nr:amidohydrolase [Fundidesulfovibrio terrae]
MLSSCDTLIRAGTLVTQDENRTILNDAAVAVTGTAIAAVGPWSELGGTPARETLDFSGDIVLPGLVNTHTHAAMTVFRGLEDDLPLMDWLTGHIWPAEARLTPEIVVTGTLLACAEMLATGTTAFCDLYIFERAVAETAAAVGIRAVLGEGVFDTPNASYSNLDQAFAKVDDLADFCRGRALLTPCLVAHSVYATGHDTLARLAGLARDRDLRLTLHAAESASETAMCLERFGARPVEILRALGILAPNLLVAHAVDVTKAEISLLAESGTAVAHNPRSNLKLASGMAPMAAMRAAGITVGLGTDGAASNNTLNMFSEMNQAALMAKAREHDPTALPAQAVLDMATIGGARALGLSDCGSIEPGRQADIVALDGRAPNLQPPHRPVSHLAYAASGHEVRLTMVAGRVLYRDGRFTTLDYPALLKRMDKVRKWALGA